MATEQTLAVKAALVTLSNFELPSCTPLPPGCILQAGIPSVETYRHLRKSGGLSVKSVEGSTIGLKNSLYSCLILDSSSKEMIGLGRVIGDGGAFVTIVDIVVVPSHQKKGLGKCIMDDLMKWIKNNVPKDAFVSLFADGDAAFLYQKYGFKTTAPWSVGMGMVA